MAECPVCKKVWKWDWCGDCHKDSKGIMAKTSCILMDDEERGDRLNIEKCTCGKIITVICDEEIYGSDVMNTAEWEGIDWEDDENNYEGNPCDDIDLDDIPEIPVFKLVGWN